MAIGSLGAQLGKSRSLEELRPSWGLGSKPLSGPHSVGPTSQPVLGFQGSFAAPPPPPLLHGEGHLPAPILGEDSNLCAAGYCEA